MDEKNNKITNENQGTRKPRRPYVRKNVKKEGENVVNKTTENKTTQRRTRSVKTNQEEKRDLVKTATRQVTKTNNKQKSLVQKNETKSITNTNNNRAIAKMPERRNKSILADTSIFKKSKLKVIPLGGLHEVGKNITVFEYEDDMIIVDCGISFPEDDMLGIDLVIPDVTYVEKNVDKLRGMVITHGHEDHIGSIPYFLKKINTPIYATKLTCGLITNK